MTKKEMQAASWVPQKARNIIANYQRRGFPSHLSPEAMKRYALAEAAIH